MGVRLAIACGLLGACGRVHFDAPRDGDGDGDGGAVGDANPDSSAVRGAVHYVDTLEADDAGMTSNTSFTLVAAASGDGVVIFVGCANATAPTSVTLTAPGWSFADVVPLYGDTGVQMFGAAFFAIAPDGVATTASVTWDITCTDIIELADSFRADAGTVTVDAAGGLAVDGSCNVATRSHHDTVTAWSACLAGNAITSTGNGFTMSADDGVGDWAEYKVTTDPSGTNEASSFVVTPNPSSAVIVTLAAL